MTNTSESQNEPADTPSESDRSAKPERAELELSEGETVDKLLKGERVVVYHSLTAAQNFDGVQERGLQGSFTIRESKENPAAMQTAGGIPYRRAYFFLAHPANVAETTIGVILNNGDSKPLKIIDSRTADNPDYAEMIRSGFDGCVSIAGMTADSLKNKNMLVLFDGSLVAHKVFRLKEELEQVGFTGQ